MNWVYILLENIDGTIGNLGYYDTIGTVSSESEAKKFIKGRKDRDYKKMPVFHGVREVMDWRFPTCAMCGKQDVSQSMEDRIFPYGFVNLTVNIPIFTCNNTKCGFQWYNWEAGEIIDAYMEQWKHDKEKKENRA